MFSLNLTKESLLRNTYYSIELSRIFIFFIFPELFNILLRWAQYLATKPNLPCHADVPGYRHFKIFTNNLLHLGQIGCYTANHKVHKTFNK